MAQTIHEIQVEVDVEVGGGVEVANLMSGLKVGTVLCYAFHAHSFDRGSTFWPKPKFDLKVMLKLGGVEVVNLVSGLKVRTRARTIGGTTFWSEPFMPGSAVSLRDERLPSGQRTSDGAHSGKTRHTLFPRTLVAMPGESPRRGLLPNYGLLVGERAIAHGIHHLHPCGAP